MSKILSQDEIDALLEDVSTKDKVVTKGSKTPKKVVRYDFRHPNLISKEQQRLLENIHEGLVRNFGVFLSAQLRMRVDIKLLAINQIVYSEFMMSVSTPGALYLGILKNPNSKFVLEFSPQLGMFIVERLFGGKGQINSTIRPISIIEQRILKRVVDRIAEELVQKWEPIKNIQCEFQSFESNPEFVQIIPASEPVVVVSIEINVQGNTMMMNICYPYLWVSRIMSSPEIQEKIIFGVQESSEQEQTLMKWNLNLTNVPLRAVLGTKNITIGEFVNLKVGDVIPLETKIKDTIPVYSSTRHLYNATVGYRDSNYAIQILSTIKGDRNHGV